MLESSLRRSLLALAVTGLIVGLATRFTPTNMSLPPALPDMIWAIATVPVVATLLVSIIRDFLIGRFGVDAIALISMSAALVLGETLAAIVVAVMYAGGTVLEDFARGRAERDLKALTDRSPRTANRKTGETFVSVGANEVAIGDEILVRAGEIVPVDGVLDDGWASLDESAVTGEPLPVDRAFGDVLRSGTINAGDAFVMRASTIAEHSTYAGIVRMVAAAHTAKAPFLRMADRYAMLMLPASLTLAALAWYASQDPVRALAVLVIATPCPLILAAPVALIGGVSRAARNGILMKGGAALEALASVRTAIFDKTGTLTTGGTDLVDCETAPGRNPDEMLRLLASLEQASQHALATSVVAAASKAGLPLSQPRNVREHRGAGLEGTVDGISVRAGSRLLIIGDKELPIWADAIDRRYRNEPVLRVFMALDDRISAIFAFGDTIRSDAYQVATDLRALGVSKMIMLTGDDERAAARVGAMLAMDEIVADASPSEKVSIVKREKQRNPTMMVGDGINDAPALAAATVGIAMSARGATAASEAADVVIIPNRVQPVVDALRLARRSQNIARQSVIAGLALSGAGMIAASLGLITPIAGALLQEGIDLVVIANALRSLRDG